MSLEWNLWYALWKIEDGLPHRSVGDEFPWEIEFRSPDQLVATTEQKKTAIPVFDYKYRVAAQVSSISDQACVIDFGLKVVGSADILPAECKRGDFVKGDITLSLTHGHYVPPEETHEALSHKWHVNAIQADMTPYISHADNPKYFFRDESRIRYEPVWSTAAVRTENYILHCFKTL